MEFNWLPEILFLTSVWAVYFFLHSYLATNKLKSLVAQNSPLIHRHYRKIYNTLSLIGLIAILIYLATRPSPLLLYRGELLTLVGLILATWGILVLRSAFRQYSIKEFLGLHSEGGDFDQKQLSTAGILKYVRHPIYSGTILVVTGYFLFNPKVLNLVTLFCVVIYILIGIKLEEGKLLKEFGEQYEEYKKRVPMLLPRWPK